MHFPPLKTCVLDEQDKQPALPPAEHDPQEESQALQVPEDESRYSVLAQVATQRLEVVRMGLFEGQERHWLKDGPEQEAQSGWHCVQVPELENMLVGQVETQEPREANWLFLQETQKSAELMQVAQEDEQVEQVPSLLAKVPSGQVSIHFPPLKNLPGEHFVHLTSEN
jgi:hypothetical protein